MDSSDLVARLEQAEGPSRELDLAIKAAVYGGIPAVSPFNGEWCLYVVQTSDGDRRGKIFEQPRSVPHAVWQNDRYTASLDAALTLVPEGMRRIEFGTYDGGEAWAYVHTPADNLGECQSAATEPLALAAAALKARAQRGE